MFNEESPLWVVHIGSRGDIEKKAINEGLIFIGWGLLGDPNQYKDRDSMKAAMKKAWPEWSDGSVRSMYGQVFRFTHEMEIGDAVVLPVKHNRTIAIGIIKGPCIHKLDFCEDGDLDYSNYRAVKWLKIVPRTSFSQGALHSFGSFSTVSTSNDYMEEVLAILEQTDIKDLPDIEDKATKAPQPQSSTESSSAESSVDLFSTALQETEDYLLKAWIRTGTAFEYVVAGVLEAIGYTAKVTQASGDHGVDVIAHTPTHLACNNRLSRFK